MIAEAGFTAEADHIAIAYRLAELARERRTTLREIVLAYVSIWKPHVRTPRARWVRALRPTCVEPDGWPKRWRWRPELCRAVFERARAFMRGELKDSCPGASNWGAKNLRSDVERGNRAVREGRWRKLDCPTSNQFYATVAASDARGAR